MLEHYHSSLTMLAKVECNINITKLAVIYREYVSKTQTHHGRKFMVGRMKDILAIAERYTIHQPIEALDFVKSDKDGFPDAFKAFKPYLRSENYTCRIIVLSIFRSVELFRLPPSHDISTVTTPPTYDEKTLESILNFLPGWVKSLNKKLRIPDMKYHYTVKKGPNGPALMNSDSDLTAIDNDTELSEAIQTVSTKLNDVFPFGDGFNRGDSGESPTRKPIHSKLTQFPEKSGKTRTIAVVDYYSQRALFPLHKGLMNLLNSLVTDGTSSHMNVGNYVKERTKNKAFVQTFDLTAFTDRFPREIQESILRLLVEDQELASAWWTILADRHFTVAWSGEEVTYAAGQPMGAYASWPLCTLAHHAVVEYCRAKRKYRLIGDDVAIADKRSAELYEETIQLLGVEVNPYKGTKSAEDALFSSAEIAKRLYLNGYDLSPLTPGLINSLRNRYLCLEGIRELKRRFSNPTLPRQFIEANFPKGKARDYVWCLVTNPINGVIKPSDEGYENFPDWDRFDIEQLKYAFKLIRLKALENKAMSLAEKGVPEGCFPINFITKVDPEKFMGGDWRLPTTQPQAVMLSRLWLVTAVFQALELLDQIDPENEQELLTLEAVEYLPDPSDPFKDLKDVRKTRMSSLVHELYLFASESDCDTATLADDIYISPYLSF